MTNIASFGVLRKEKYLNVWLNGGSVGAFNPGLCVFAINEMKWAKIQI
jgi:hypothetical protein